MKSVLVPGLALDVALRRQQLLAGLLDLEVDVGRPARIGHRLDRAEVILAARTGQEPAEALEVGVAVRPPGISGVNVNSLAIHLPDLHERIATGLPRASRIRPLRWVTSPTAGVMPSLTIRRSLSVSSGSLLG